MNASSSKWLQFPKVKFYSTDFCFIGLHRCVERAHPLAEKLNKLINEGKIPEECLFYKYLNDTTSFAMIDSSKASDFHWDHEVCEFFETVKYLGGQRTRNFLRGPGFHGTGRVGEKNRLRPLQISISVVHPIMFPIAVRQAIQQIVG